ncbi:hypothetical protein [Neorickettsia sennetsu]|uniref:Uncharacterized protein n=1 Tax=Ehrlichia sennetsu (strain ATCC VR-367 / Miyayama) TaxID=222891 RepID=Q2GEU1_EHRS3|nr:hypothetical protein [Neorickettsia sennetsu]ABD45679.1 hypothetical protein NSE_0105 [Neorickettsia sennetsu str. Miyayama]
MISLKVVFSRVAFHFFRPEYRKTVFAILLSFSGYVNALPSTALSSNTGRMHKTVELLDVLEVA